MPPGWRPLGTHGGTRSPGAPAPRSEEHALEGPPGCGARVTQMPEERELPPERVAALLEEGGAQVVDVRTPEEHEAGYIAGARHIPVAMLSEAAGELDRSRPLVLYCRGGERSGTAAEAFAASGWEAYSMEGGLLAWSEAGLPLEPEAGEVAARDPLPPS